MPAFSSVLKTMKYFLLRLTIFVSIATSFFLNPLAVNVVEADYLKVTSPAEVTQDTQFEVGLQIAAKPDTKYYLKGRLGQALNSLTKAQTFDEKTGVWLSDTVSWDRFPEFQTDSDGHWTGRLKIRPNQTTALGKNLLVIRIRNSSDNSNKDSEPYQISVVEAPKIPEPPKVEAKGEPILNEFMSTPSDGQEWVEIKNKGTGNIELSGWLIDDEEGKSSPFEVPQGTVVAPNSFYVAYFSSAKLNDLTDSVRLLRADNSLVEEYRYNSPEKGKSFAKNSSGAWFLTDTPTPGTVNPNPLEAGPTQSTPNKTKVLAEQTEVVAEESLSTSLPKLTNSTESAKVATVSASFGNKKTNENFLNKLPFVFGGLLIFVALGILGKNTYLKLKVKSPQLATDTEEKTLE